VRDSFRTGPITDFFAVSGWFAVAGSALTGVRGATLATVWLEEFCEFWGFDLEQPKVPTASSRTSKAANALVAALPLGATLIAARSIDVEIELLKFFT